MGRSWVRKVCVRMADYVCDVVEMDLMVKLLLKLTYFSPKRPYFKVMRFIEGYTHIITYPCASDARIKISGGTWLYDDCEEDFISYCQYLNSASRSKFESSVLHNFPTSMSTQLRWRINPFSMEKVWWGDDPAFEDWWWDCKMTKFERIGFSGINELRGGEIPLLIWNQCAIVFIHAEEGLPARRITDLFDGLFVSHHVKFEVTEMLSREGSVTWHVIDPNFLLVKVLQESLR